MSNCQDSEFYDILREGWLTDNLHYLVYYYWDKEESAEPEWTITLDREEDFFAIQKFNSFGEVQTILTKLKNCDFSDQGLKNLGFTFS